MRRPQHTARHLSRVADRLQREAELAALAQQVRQVALGVERLRVLRAQHLHPARERLAEKDLRVVRLAHRLQQQPQLVHADQRLRVLVAEERALLLQTLAQQRLGLLELRAHLRAQQRRQVGERRDVLLPLDGQLASIAARHRGEPLASARAIRHQHWLCDTALAAGVARVVQRLATRLERAAEERLRLRELFLRHAHQRQLLLHRRGRLAAVAVDLTPPLHEVLEDRLRLGELVLHPHQPRAQLVGLHRHGVVAPELLAARR